jgi:glycosyltransferase involved in cell wall biosynthesis
LSELDRIGVNLLYLVPQRGGVGTYSRRLLDAMVAERPRTRFVVYAGRDTIQDLQDEAWADAVEFVPSPVRARHKARRIGAELTWLPWRAHRDRVRVLHSHGNTAPIRARMPMVTTIHDLIYLRFPASHPPAVRAALDRLIPRAARAAARVTVPSNATRDDLVDLLAVPTDRIDVTPLGPGRPAVTPRSEDELRAELGAPGSALVLSVAAGLAHKNLPRLLEGFAGVPRSHDAILVQLGATGSPQEATLRELAGRLGVADRVRFIYRWDDAMLDAAYRHATLLVHPSLHEGFGFVVLEAMSRGCAVACSETSSLAEIAGDAAELFDPHSVPEIRDSIVRLLTDAERRRELERRGAARAPRFTWEDAAGATFESLDRAVAEA